MLEMHQSPSKGERTAARLPSLSQRGRERQKQQPGCNPAAPSESAGEGRKFLREAARQAGQTGQAHIPNSSRALRNTEHVPHALKALGGDDNGSRGVSFSSAGHSALCEEGQQQQPREKLLAHTSPYSCALRSSKSSGPEQPCCWTLLLTCELCVLIQPLLSW